MDIVLHAICPHCKRAQRYFTEITDRLYGSGIMNCYEQEGGCGEEFAIRWQLQPRIEVSPVQFKEHKDNA